MLTDEQLAIRRTGIGASEIAAIAGLDPYRTPLDVWLDKRGLVERDEETEPQYWGQAIEPLLRSRYIAELRREGEAEDIRFVEESRTHRNPLISHALCTPDLSVTTRDGLMLWGVECKNKSAYVAHEWGETGSTDVPAYVQLQCQWSMLVTGVDRWDVAVLLGGNDFRRYRLRRDPKVVQDLADMAEAFWQKVLSGEEPEAEAKDNPKLARRLKQETESLVTAPPEMEAVALDLVAAKQAAKVALERIDAAEARLKQAIGPHAGMLGRFGWRALWKQPKPTRVTDWHAIADRYLNQLSNAEAMDLVSQHTTERANTRRFTFTPAKDTDHE